MALAYFTTEEIDGLNKHNLFRMVHKVPVMTLDRQMCNEAKAYAEKLASWKNLTHASLTDQGENLYYGCQPGKAASTKKAVRGWYFEVCYPGYDFIDGPIESGTGHFTQVVWRESIKLGIGRAVTNDKYGNPCGYIVARYKPAGNVIGRFKQNVLKGDYNAEAYCSQAVQQEKEVIR
ncbi:Golgi-associated plant pathogenesis-related protein 1-like [Montipora capricornis]|uniref:Golgi-associated plant pathogenesis-related protein 1-like n=1 Tax=Montipora capricornis TaxID=246305 RepID=UPI0035F101E4